MFKCSAFACGKPRGIEIRDQIRREAGFRACGRIGSKNRYYNAESQKEMAFHFPFREQ
jgi:hypothetical protein